MARMVDTDELLRRMTDIIGTQAVELQKRDIIIEDLERELRELRDRVDSMEAPTG